MQKPDSPKMTDIKKPANAGFFMSVISEALLYFADYIVRRGAKARVRNSVAGFTMALIHGPIQGRREWFRTPFSKTFRGLRFRVNQGRKTSSGFCKS